MQSSYRHPLLGEITLSQSARSRRISIAVKPSGEVRLSFPRSTAMRRALEFLDSKSDWVVAARKRMAQKVSAQPTYTPAEIEALRQRAKAMLPPRVEELAQRFGFRYGRVTVRATRSKWGSCTAENNLSLSLWLMTLPSHLIDYVIIHELCHTVHHNHSPRFHALLDRCLGGREKALQKELRTCQTGCAVK